jgi:zinc transport system permease protein
MGSIFILLFTNMNARGLSGVSDFFIEEIVRLLGYQFFQYALVGGALVALICAVVGLLIVLRKESMIGDSVAHTAFGGIAVGILLGVEPILTALVFAVVAVLLIAYMRSRGLAHSDSAMAVMLAAGFSLGLIVVSSAGGFTVDLFSYLFGSILTIDTTELIVTALLAMISLAVMGLFYKELLSITFDEQAARLNGIPVTSLSITFNILVAVTIVISIKVVGIILVAALLVLPGLSALQLGQSFRKTLLASIFLALLTTTLGIFISALFDVAASGIIVFTGVGVFLLAVTYGRLGR